jgi:quercetin dioxygenase-like cupin family protein
MVKPSENYLTFLINNGDERVDMYKANKGYGMPLHSHSEKHSVLCKEGSCIIKINNKENIINKNSGIIDLPANNPHEIEAVEDNTVFMCIHKNTTLPYTKI